MLMCIRFISGGSSIGSLCAVCMEQIILLNYQLKSRLFAKMVLSNGIHEKVLVLG